MKAESTIRREESRVAALQRRDDLTEWQRGAMYGARQALSWVTSDHYGSPSAIVPKSPAEAVPAKGGK